MSLLFITIATYYRCYWFAFAAHLNKLPPGYFLPLCHAR
ncbi:hypothetical protein YPPY66_0942 [Yersinia pestis PY-66]|nr:hypothetical protein YPC_3917 [Yersinia pestis biovar Medievalis str. Harbin 35]EDR40368.1 hypothetical protein YpF1991016_1429 [Yersinia pestis biovar Orientalis str. F1991016]EDR59354.1 hypothetical protein YpMG051020_1883 [Yersinia pestis biovar Orientalis str. MG05-1020]EEO78309.1 hypothetical protein YP516_0539 [Yersinia pestis Nepal516]EEO82225.1 hypothetical protein YPF_1249 [Yersinia pestis biovar Orientalis str. India 195]EEO86964.1 hypothetical protein YPH_2894 [Yersinia pestis bi